MPVVPRFQQDHDPLYKCNPRHRVHRSLLAKDRWSWLPLCQRDNSYHRWNQRHNIDPVDTIRCMWQMFVRWTIRNYQQNKDFHLLFHQYPHNISRPHKVCKTFAQ